VTEWAWICAASFVWFSCRKEYSKNAGFLVAITEIGLQVHAERTRCVFPYRYHNAVQYENTNVDNS